MKIGIITFHASFNYGSMLQAWALQTFLEKQGHEVKIINYRQKSQKTGQADNVQLAAERQTQREKDFAGSGYDRVALPQVEFV